jgi:hypothetical protein
MWWLDGIEKCFQHQWKKFPVWGGSLLGGMIYDKGLSFSLNFSGIPGQEKLTEIQS